MFSAMKQVKQLKISGWPTIFGRDQKNLSFWPFLAFEGRLGGLKDPLEVRVQHETYRSMSWIYVQAILSQKNWTGLAGVLRNGRNQSKYDFCSVGWPLLVKNQLFLVGTKKTCLFDHFWPLRAVWEALKTPQRCELKTKLVLDKNLASEPSWGPWDPWNGL